MLDDLTKYLERLQLQNKSKSGAKPKLTTNPDLKKITITSHKGAEFVDLDQIQYLEASGMYCVFHCVQGDIVVSKPLGEYEYLEEHGFYRIHRSFIVNTAFVKGINQINGTEVKLKNGKMISLSRIRKDGFKSYMSDNFGSWLAEN